MNTPAPHPAAAAAAVAPGTTPNPGAPAATATPTPAAAGPGGVPAAGATPFGMMTPAAGVPVQDQAPQSVSGAENVTFDDEVKLRRLERYPKLEKDEVTLNAFVALDANGVPLMKTGQIHYLAPELGHPQKLVIRAPDPNKNPQLAQACVRAFGEPRTNFITLLYRYATDRRGQLPVHDGKLIVKGTLFAYRFGADKWPLFQNLHKQWGLGTHDVNFICTEPNYQKITPAPTQYSLWRDESVTPPEVTTGILNEVAALIDSLGNELGRVLNDEQIQGLLAGYSLDQQRSARLAQNVNPVSPFMGNVNPFASGGGAPAIAPAGGAPMIAAPVPTAGAPATEAAPAPAVATSAVEAAPTPAAHVPMNTIPGPAPTPAASTTPQQEVIPAGGPTPQPAAGPSPAPTPTAGLPIPVPTSGAPAAAAPGGQPYVPADPNATAAASFEHLKAAAAPVEGQATDAAPAAEVAAPVPAQEAPTQAAPAAPVPEASATDPAPAAEPVSADPQVYDLKPTPQPTPAGDGSVAPPPATGAMPFAMPEAGKTA